MATERVIHNSKLLRLFPDFEPSMVLKKGSTSVICHHPKYDNYVIVYTTDKAKVDWFDEISNQIKFRLLSSVTEGSAYDEIPKKIYCFQIRLMYTLDEKRKKFVQEEILDKFENIKGFMPNMKFFKMARDAKDKRLKYMFSRLKKFVEHHRVETDLKLDSFMKLPNGDIICTDPIYATKER